MAEFESRNAQEPAERPAPAEWPPAGHEQPVYARVEPPESRFLFVDIAAQRAKQLRRGARPRLEGATGVVPHKLERIAMQEVQRGLIAYQFPRAGPEVMEAA